MKRITIVTDAWHPQVNGAVRVIEQHIRLLERQGYKVTLVHPGQFSTVRIPFYPEIFLALFPRRRVRRLLEEYQPDAVHIATEGPLGWSARRYCIHHCIPFTTWYHTHFQLYINVWVPGLLTIVNVFLRRFHAPAMRTMVSTPSLKQSLERVGFTHVIVVTLGVDIERFARNPSPSLPPLTKPVFVYFGRLAPEKSPGEFLQLQLPGTKLVIGDGVDRQKLEKKYPDVHFVGYKYGKELVEWLSLCDVFVFPSRTETFGLVVVEALACSIPVAAHDVMGPRDIITHGKDGYLSENLQEAALACLQLSPADCRAKALQYSWEHSTDMFLQNLAFRK